MGGIKRTFRIYMSVQYQYQNTEYGFVSPSPSNQCLALYLCPDKICFFDSVKYWQHLANSTKVGSVDILVGFFMFEKYFFTLSQPNGLRFLNGRIVWDFFRVFRFSLNSVIDIVTSITFRFPNLLDVKIYSVLHYPGNLTFVQILWCCIIMIFFWVNQKKRDVLH